MPVLRNEILKLQHNPDSRELIDLCSKMLIKSHLGREDIPYLYELLAMKVNSSLKFLAFTALRQKNISWNDADKLAAALNCSPVTAEALLISNITIVSFPVMNAHSLNDEKAALALSLIVELPDENLFIYEDKKDDLLNLSQLTGKKFFVLFDTDICNRSYMLSIAAGLTVRNKELLNSFAFSGSISSQGNVEPVDSFEAKKSCCDEKGLRLIYGSFSLATMLNWLEEKPVPVPLGVMVGNSISRDGPEKISSSMEADIRQYRQHFSWKCLDTFYGLNPQNMLIFEPDDLPSDGSQWLSLITGQIKPAINNSLSATPTDRRELHIFGTIASLMFAAGVMVRDYTPFTAWHFSQRKYYNVISTLGKDRDLKKRKSIGELKTISYTVEDSRQEMAVIVFFASHDMLNSVRRFIESKGLDCGLIYINDQNNQGNLPVPADWTVYVNEVYNLLNHLKDGNDIRKFHFFFGCPIPIAFALGAAIGSYWDIDAYQFDRGKSTYFKVYSVRDL